MPRKLKPIKVTIDFSYLGMTGEIALVSAIITAVKELDEDAAKGDIVATNASWALKNIMLQLRKQNDDFFRDVELSATEGIATKPPKICDKCDSSICNHCKK